MRPGRLRRKWWGAGVVVAAMVSASPGTGLAGPAPAATGPISTFAGSLGAGPATNLGQDAEEMAVGGRTLYLATTAPVRSVNGPMLWAVNLDTGIERVVAGTGERGMAVDGPAAESPFFAIGDLTVDAAGNVLVLADGRLRRIDGAGQMTSIAGGGTSSEDGIPATEARLGGGGIALDAAGAIYISDSTRVRRIDADGTISTVAGVGGPEYRFDGDGGPALKAHLYRAGDLAFDPDGNLYIADGLRVRRVDRQGIITTVAGGGTYPPGASGVRATAIELYPQGLAFDPSGNLYVASLRWLDKIDAGGRITTIAGNGDTVVRRDGREVDPGDGEPATGVALAPTRVAADAAGNVYATEWGRSRVRRISPSGIITTVAGNGTLRLGGDGGPARLSQLFTPSAAAVDRAGNVYIADSENGRIRKVSPDGTITSLRQKFLLPRDIAVDDAGRLYVTIYGNVIMRVDPDGVVTRWAGGGVRQPVDGEPATSGAIMPYDLAVDRAGNLYIAAGHVYKVDTAGVLTTVAGSGFAEPTDGLRALSASVTAVAVQVNPAGRVLFTDLASQRVLTVDADGRLVTVAGSTQGFSGDGGPATAAKLNLGYRYGNVPGGLAVDEAGEVFILDRVNNVVRRVGTSGIITTVAGNGETGPATVRLPAPGGEGMPATSVRNAASDLAVDRSGNLLLVESGYDRIRSVEGVGLAAAPAASASVTSPGAAATPAGTRAPVATLSTPAPSAIPRTGPAPPATSVTASVATSPARAMGAPAAPATPASEPPRQPIAGTAPDRPPAGAPVLVAAGRPVAVTTAPVAWGWRLAGVVALAAVTLSSAWTWRRRLA